VKSAFSILSVFFLLLIVSLLLCLGCDCSAKNGTADDDDYTGDDDDYDDDAGDDDDNDDSTGDDDDSECTPEASPDLPAILAVPPEWYVNARKSILSCPCAFLEDFSTCNEIDHTTLGDDLYQGNETWWFLDNPPFQDGDFLVLTSSKAKSSQPDEAQSITEFNGGSMIIGVWSDRWPNDQGWTDTSFGYEMYGNPVHDAVVFTDGAFGVLSEESGSPDPETNKWYDPIDCGTWDSIRAEQSPKIFKIEWKPQSKEVRLFRYIATSGFTPCFESEGAEYITQNLRIRLNANLDDATDPVTQERLFVDFVCIADSK